MMTNNVVLLMDIGGTHSRARILAANEDLLVRPRQISQIQTVISDKKSLFNFISQVITGNQLKNRIDIAVLCFAGPVTDHTRVTITNWDGKPSISYGELLDCGLPKKTLLYNDLEAAAHFFESNQYHQQCFTNIHVTHLHEYNTANIPPRGNIVLVAPGTGVGCAGVVYPEHDDNRTTPSILPCEIQHTFVAPLIRSDRKMFDKISKYTKKDRLTWEDLISGHGLINIYSYLRSYEIDSCRTRGISSLLTRAEDIAEHAINHTDKLSSAALNIYYRYTGALTQLLALVFQPLGGIYLAGETIKRNFSFIPKSDFLHALHDNNKQYRLLEKFPVYLISDDLNLHGATYLAGLHLERNSQISLFS